MQELLDGGLTDLGDGTGHTVPTAINADHMHFAKLRLDYALANDALVAWCDVSSELVRDAETGHLSDHYPLLTLISCGETDHNL